MNWPEHSFIGFISFFIIGFLLLGYTFTSDYTPLLILSCFAAFSALVPDIDHHQSKLRQHLNMAVPAFSFIFFFIKMNNILMAGNL